MTVYQYNVYAGETFNASGKAKGDIVTILENMGIKKLYSPSSIRAIRVIQQIFAIVKLKIKKKSTVIVQYPAVIDSFINEISKSSHLIAVIHDLQSIRYDKDVNSEINILNKFDVLISHNSKMTNYLRENGCNVKILELSIFDYLCNDNIITNSYFSRKMISFAGNLNKSNFVNSLYKIKDVNFNLYGLIDNAKSLNGVTYSGVLPSDEIANKLEGEYGLIWDGNDIDTCSGKLGNYLMFNNPHKLSLYLASGKPVIVWEKSAISSFVEKNGIGKSISSLEDLPKLISNIDESEYSAMRKNVLNIRGRIISGKYTKRAVTGALFWEERNE